MGKMTSMLLMLVLLAVFIGSSKAIKCHMDVCVNCDEPSQDLTCDGERCVKQEIEVSGAFTISSGIK